MRILVKMLRQVAVYWPPAGLDDFNRKTYGPPVEVPVRWVDEVVEVLNTKGDTVLTNSVVYTDRDVATGGVLWLSSKMKGYTPGDALAELTSSINPFANALAYEVQKFSKVPTIKATAYLRRAYL